jgi:hypothetical protein
MNRIYFGDIRDLFKFDLIRHIMKSLPELSGFTYVPMFSEAGGKGGGQKKRTKDIPRALAAGKAGTQNRDLSSLMLQMQDAGSTLEYANGLNSYFEKEQIATEIFHKTRFTHENRDHYFRNIFSHFPTRSLVFFDPDTGLEEGLPTEKHLLFSEVKAVHDTMDAGSILMVYQHFPRVKRAGYIRNRCSQLIKLTGSVPVVITDNEIIFFFLVKNPKQHGRLYDCIESYANSYPDLKSCACA